MKCKLCSHELSIFLDLKEQPLANKYPKFEDFDKEKFYPLNVLFCEQCNNVQLSHAVSREVMFEDYFYLSSVNKGLVRHFEKLAHKLKDSRFVLDVGSNDGILLKPLKKLGVESLGVDPSVNVSKIANDAGLTTLVGFFDDKMVKSIKRDYGRPDVIVASSIFTHLEDPHRFIKCIKDLLSENGKFILEVEYIGNILSKVHFERFYLDRIFYYSLTSIKHLFENHGLKVVDVEEIEPHGGSLQITICKNSTKVSENVNKYLEKEKKDLNTKSLNEFVVSVKENIQLLKDKLIEYKNDGLKVAAYGSPARVSTICNYGEIGPSLIEYTVDDSPLKQGRFTPGTHIPIVSKEHLEAQNPDIIVVFAYEYFEDIKNKLKGDYRFLFPIPPREVI